MFNIKHQIIDNSTHKYKVTRDGRLLAYSDALNLWQNDDAFRAYFSSLLAKSPFTAYRWETPPITDDTVNREFEFVLLNSPRLARSPDTKAYADHFANADDNGIVVFDNLGKDAVLVVPAPSTINSSYDHLAAFIRSAPDSQIHAFWRIVAQTVRYNITNRPRWLSTAGGGVAWVHVRLDSRPKYYGYAPYKKPCRKKIADGNSVIGVTGRANQQE